MAMTWEFGVNACWLVLRAQSVSAACVSIESALRLTFVLAGEVGQQPGLAVASTWR
jgi:hypothetical protein